MKGGRRFTCEDSFRRLDEYLGRVLSETEFGRVEEHLAVCADCAREYRFEEGVLTGIRLRILESPMPDDFKVRLAARLAELVDRPG